MSAHPDKKQLIDIMLGSVNDKASAAAIAHLEECRECADAMESLKTIIHESDNSSIVPPEHIKNSLFSTRNKSYKPAYNKNESLISVLKMLLRPAAVAVTAVVIAAAAITIFYVNKDQPPLNVALKLSQHHGSIVYNNTAFGKDTAEINPGRIQTGSNSSVFLSLEPAFSISIAENTDMSVVSAQTITEKEAKKYTASLEMKSGSIMVSSNHNVIKKYTISTPHAVFEPLGTGFILSIDNTSSWLSVLEGTVRVSASDNKEIILNKGEGCEINGGFKKINIDSEKAVVTFNRLFYNIKDKNSSAPEKRPEQDIPANENSRYSKEETKEEINNTASDNQADTQKQEKAAKELRENKSELRNESRQIQKEMQDNRRSGKGSQR